MYMRHDVRFAFVYCSICRDAWWKKSRIPFFRLLDIDQHQKFFYVRKRMIKRPKTSVRHILRRHQRFPREMTSEKRAQKIHTNDMSLPRSG